jgi:D-serine deaminase-like pyridoxal phosphate-dependent protein
VRAAASATRAPAVGRPVAELETPAPVVDLDLLERNLARAAEYARDHGLELYPHSKTHKTREIAELQLAAGAAGLTTAKSTEAEIFAGVLGAPLVLHYPVVGVGKVARVAEVAGMVPLTMALDSAAAAAPIAEALRARGTEAEALVELDVGLARTGLDPERALELARAIDAFGGGLRFAGLSCYPGHLRHTEATVAAGISEVGAALERARALLEEAGLDCRRISGGSTATLFHSHETPVSEIRPGNYALLDRHEARGEFELGDCALRVHTTVVSTTVPGRFIVDAGAKTLSEAGPPPAATGYAEIVGRDGLEIELLSEEHGHGVAGSGEVPAVGERLELIPNHACTCVNLHDVLYLARDGIVEAEMAVVARGAVR